MSKPMRLDEFTRLPARARAVTVDGLSGLIDVAAEGAPHDQHFLRYHWYAAALAAGRGAARTIIVECDGDPVIALPYGDFDRPIARLAGRDWPRRSFPARLEADDAAFDMLLRALGEQVRALAIGPSDSTDRPLMHLIAAARARRWTVVERACVPAASPARDGAFWHDATGDAIVAGALETVQPPAQPREWLLVRPGLSGAIARLGWRWAPYRSTSRV
jgi:hypothetical protein